MRDESAAEQPRSCPECGTEPDEVQRQFGFCPQCGKHTLLVGMAGTTVTPIVMGEGGILRCCSEPRNAWALLNPGPWPDDAEMPCLYYGYDTGNWYAHGLVHRGGKWYSRPTKSQPE